jgi:hypothetical protein
MLMRCSRDPQVHTLQRANPRPYRLGGLNNRHLFSHLFLLAYYVRLHFLACRGLLSVYVSPWPKALSLFTFYKATCLIMRTHCNDHLNFLEGPILHVVTLWIWGSQYKFWERCNPVYSKAKVYFLLKYQNLSQKVWSVKKKKKKLERFTLQNPWVAKDNIKHVLEFKTIMTFLNW